MPLPKEKERYTYTDYITWDDNERWELIYGVPYMMAPPSLPHQGISLELSRQLGNFLQNKPCKVFTAPIGVRLTADANDDTVLQPDIVVVCDYAKLDNKGVIGAPDMVVEILSPSTARVDRFEKFRIYESAGVREYWIVDPESRTAQVHILDNEKFNFIKTYRDNETVPVHVLDGCTISLPDTFPDSPFPDSLQTSSP